MTDDVVTVVPDDTIVAYLRRFIREQRHAPTVAQVARAMGWRSRATAQRRLDKLRQGGRITGSGRALAVVPDPAEARERIREVTERLSARAAEDAERYAGRIDGTPGAGPLLDAYRRGWEDGFRIGVGAIREDPS